jgi:DNA-binding MarR family transcriptional regulator
MRWRASVDAALAPLGLTHADYAVMASLFGLARAGVTPSQRELADHTGLDPIYISKLVRRLESDGLIGRARDPVDSRALRLTLTDRGADVIGPAIEVVGDLQQQLTAPLGGVNSDRMQSLIEDLGLLLTHMTPSERTEGNTKGIRA